MSQFCELTVTIKDSEKNLKKKFLIYEIFTIADNDKVIKNCVEETLEEFCGEPEDIKVRINLEYL